MSERIDLKNISELIESKKKISIPKYTVSDLILWLLYANGEIPIIGRISFFKQIFLQFNEVLPNEIKRNTMDPKFVEYDYGPYSFLVADILEELKYTGNVCVKGRKNSLAEKISLTNNGKKNAEERINRISEEIKSKLFSELKHKRILWDQLRNEGLLNYVYSEYPTYTTKSKIKKKVTHSIWEVGRTG